MPTAIVSLRKTDSVSQQEADQQTSGYQQAKANLAAADANVRRLRGAGSRSSTCTLRSPEC